MHRNGPRVLVVAATAALCGVAGKAPGAETADNVILDTSSLWRVRVVRERDEVTLKDGTVDHVRLTYNSKAWGKRNTIEAFTAEKVNPIRLPTHTSSDWMQPDFDDSTWVRCRGPLFATDPKGRKGGWGSPNVNWKLLLLRGRFEVTDPATAEGLTLSLAFRGGAVVYLNGAELTRAHMPAGEISLYALAQPYPDDVYLTQQGHLISTFDHRLPGVTERMRKRLRHLSGFRVPASKLRKGVNVLAVAIHRPPAPWMFYTTRIRPYPFGIYDGRNKAAWSRMALWQVRLAALPGAAVAPKVSGSGGAGLLAWNHGTLCKVHASDYADPHEPLRPVRITGVRNGAFAGQVVVGCAKPIRGLSVAVTDLSGPGTIPASAVEVRYGRPDGAVRRGGVPWFDSLDEVAPAEVRVHEEGGSAGEGHAGDWQLPEVPVYEEGGSAVQPIWITVRIPRTARPGDYRGTVTIRADGARPIRVPLEVRAIDWTLPDTTAFTADVDMFQSPESVAMQYNVPMWSESHWRLLDKTFGLLAPLGVKTLYITCVRRTHLGNEHAMVRWVRGADGGLTPDLSVAERYLDVAITHLGKVPGVILYAWEPPNSMGHAGSGPSRTHDREILITIVDPTTGRLSKAKGPVWGTPECRAFWRSLNTAALAMLRKRGMAGSMMLGLLGDHRPTKRAMDDLSTGAPDVGWAVHSHNYCDTWMGYDMRMCVALWGVKCYPADPDEGYGYGWRNPFWLAYNPREMHLASPLVEHRIKIESRLSSKPWNMSRWPRSAGVRGIGRLGADFWPVLKDRHGRRRALAARYPETYWGQLCLNYGIPRLLGAGRNGPVPTVRSEAFRENMQEIEARVFIEKALLDDATRARLGADLARRCRVALDERIRMALYSAGEGWVWFAGSGWEQRTETLFRLASEAAKALEQGGGGPR